MPGDGASARSRPLELYHERTRRRGVNSLVYWPARLVLKPAILLFWRLRRTGRAHIPAGGVILAANHRSFLDPFLIGCCLGRPIYFVAKRELFHKPLIGWFLNCMGAFPIRRGESDEQSMATALALLERGQAVVIFPEGTRHPQRLARLAQARRRSAGAAERQAGGADRDHRQRARPQRLADQARQAQDPLRRAADLPAASRIPRRTSRVR